MQSANYGTDGAIRDVEMFANRLGLPSPNKVNYGKDFEPDAVFDSNPLDRPNMRRGGIGSR